jgi:hypothetical protein
MMGAIDNNSCHRRLGIMRKLFFALCLLSSTLGFSASLEIIQDGITYSCEPTDGSGGRGYASCAEASLKKNGYVSSDCKKIQNDAQDRCAGRSIELKGFVSSNCLTLDAGGRCAIASLNKNGHVTSDCQRIQNSRQDRCAAASIQKIGHVTSDCLGL